MGPPSPAPRSAWAAQETALVEVVANISGEAGVELLLGQQAGDVGGVLSGAGDLLLTVNMTLPKGLSVKDHKWSKGLAETMTESPRRSLDV